MSASLYMKTSVQLMGTDNTSHTLAKVPELRLHCLPALL